MDIEYVDQGKAIPPTEDGREMEEAIAITEINDGNARLEFKIETAMISQGPYSTVVLDLFVEGEFNERLSPDSIKLTANIIEGENTESSVFDFPIGYIETDGATMWPREEIKSGGRGNETAYLGFDAHGEEITILGDMNWYIHDEDLRTYTLELEADIGGLSEDIKSTVQVTISNEVKTNG